MTDYQYTYYQPRSDDIYALPPKYIKNNETIILGNIWNNLIMNISEQYQIISDEHFEFLLNKFMYNDETGNYGNINANDIYVIDTITSDKTYYVLPGLQPRKPDGSPAASGDSVDFIKTLDYGHNRTRVMKQCFKYYGTWIYNFLFTNNDMKSIFFSNYLDGNNTRKYGPYIRIKQIPYDDSNEELGATSGSIWKTFASELYNNVSYLRDIDKSYDSVETSISLGYDTYFNNDNPYLYIDRFERLFLLPYENNFPTFQYITLNISTLNHKVLVGNPNGTYYILEPYTSNSLIIPNPKFTYNEFGYSRYYYFFTDDNFNSKVLAKFKIVAIDDNLNILDDVTDYIAIINSLETSPDIKLIQESYISARMVETVDTMYTTLFLYNYLIPILYHYFNIVSISLDLKSIVQNVKWFFDLSANISDYTFTSFIQDYYTFKTNTNQTLDEHEERISSLEHP